MTTPNFCCSECAGRVLLELQGTWRSNREATVAAAFHHDPRWTNAPPKKVARFREMFGDMTVTYYNGIATSSFCGETHEDAG